MRIPPLEHGFICPNSFLYMYCQVCLHPDFVCDGYKQCPHQDDELLCGLVCPSGCICQGLAFICPNTFNTSLYPQLRFLDASGSLLHPSDLSHNTLLIHLNLSNCHLHNLILPILPNLLVLDLSWNSITDLHMDSFSMLTNLNFLILSNNPIYKLSSDTVSSNKKIILLDLSSTLLQKLERTAFMCCPNVKHLNLFDTPIQYLPQTVFSKNQLIETLDFRFDSDFEQAPKNLLINLKYLDNVKTNNFRFCCPVMLPNGFNYKNCRYF